MNNNTCDNNNINNNKTKTDLTDFRDSAVKSYGTVQKDK